MARNKLDIRKEDGSRWLPGPVSRRQEKKHRSEKVVLARRLKCTGGTFTRIVEAQEGRCFFCNEDMGVDCTREHLLARARGGGNEAENIKAAHGDCNSAAGHLPVDQKLRLRAIGHAEGRGAMIDAAHRMRRAQTRDTFRKYGTTGREPEYRGSFVVGEDGKMRWVEGPPKAK